MLASTRPFHKNSPRSVSSGTGNRNVTRHRSSRSGRMASAGKVANGSRKAKSVLRRAASGRRTSTSTTAASAVQGTGAAQRVPPARSYPTAADRGRGRGRRSRLSRAQASKRVSHRGIECVSGRCDLRRAAGQTRRRPRDSQPVRAERHVEHARHHLEGKQEAREVGRARGPALLVLRKTSPPRPPLPGGKGGVRLIRVTRARFAQGARGVFLPLPFREGGRGGRFFANHHLQRNARM